VLHPIHSRKLKEFAMSNEQLRDYKVMSPDKSFNRGYKVMAGVIVGLSAASDAAKRSATATNSFYAGMKHAIAVSRSVKA